MTYRKEIMTVFNLKNNFEFRKFSLKILSCVWINQSVCLINTPFPLLCLSLHLTSSSSLKILRANGGKVKR